jgi:pimeloyl-ACP methyl ester carboxylesterase
MAFQAEPFLELDQIKVPFLVGAGAGTDADAAGQAAPACRVAEQARAELYVGEGADHFAHTNQPAVWAELVRRTVDLAARSNASG